MIKQKGLKIKNKYCEKIMVTSDIPGFVINAQKHINDFLTGAGYRPQA